MNSSYVTNSCLRDEGTQYRMVPMESLFQYLTDLTGSVAYLIVFSILLACGLGFPLPEDIPLIATGYLIWDGTMSIVSALLVCFLGVLIGDSILFYIGHRMGFAVLKRPRFQRFFPPKKVRRTKAYFRKYGDKIVFYARFVAGFRAVAFFLSGAMHMKYRKFIFFDAIAAVLSVPIWIVLGYYLGHFFGDEFGRMMHGIKEAKTIFTLVVATVAIVFLIRALINYQKKRKISLNTK